MAKGFVSPRVAKTLGRAISSLRAIHLTGILIIGLLAHCDRGLAQIPAPKADDWLVHFRASLMALPDLPQPTRRQNVYVPVYSSVAGAGGLARLDFSATLSIRNASEASALIIERIDYFDTAGKLVERYLRAPVALRPLATIEIYIPTDDVRGGTGANFIVGWAATDSIAEPVIEAVMVGSSGTRGFAFVVPGRLISTIADR